MTPKRDLRGSVLYFPDPSKCPQKPIQGPGDDPTVVRVLKHWIWGAFISRLYFPCCNKISRIKSEQFKNIKAVRVAPALQFTLKTREEKYSKKIQRTMLCVRYTLYSEIIALTHWTAINFFFNLCYL